MRFLLDTDHLSILQWQSGAEFARLAVKIAQYSTADFALSTVSFHEQVLGCNAYISRARTAAAVVHGYDTLSKVIQSFSWATVLPFDAGAAAVAEQLVAQRVKISTMDRRIAAIAIVRRLTLLTRNTVDFSQVPGLSIEDWTT